MNNDVVAVKADPRRDYFAASALTGLLARGTSVLDAGRLAVVCADKVIVELDSRSSNE